MSKKPPRIIRVNPKNGARKQYPSAAAAARELGLDDVTLANAAARRCGMYRYGGFTWEHVPGYTPKTPGPFAGHTHTEETREKMSRAKDAKKTPVTALTDSGRVVARYESIAAATRAVGLKSHATIRKVLAKQQIHASGFLWKRS